MDDVQQDVRYAVRGLARRPLLTATATLCFAIGIGANAAMFSVIDQLLLRPPTGVRDLASLAWISVAVPGSSEPSSLFTYEDYLDFERSSDGPQLAAYSTGNTSFGRGTGERNLDVLIVTNAFMSVLGTTPARGRFFTAADERPEAARVVVLGYSFWQTQFGGRGDIIGQVVRLGTTPYTVVGVARPGFNGVERSRIDAYVPPTLFVDRSGAQSPLTDPGFHWATLVARVRPGPQRQRLVADLDAIYHDADATSDHQKNARIIAAAPGSLPTMDPGRLKQVQVSFWLYGVAALLLLIACANVAGLLLARAAGRRREIAIRLAMGISRARLARLLITESMVLSCIGCGLALVLARTGAGVLRAALLSDLDPVTGFIDLRVAAVTLATTLLTGFACGLAPALAAARSDVAIALKTGEREASPGTSRVNGVLVAGQVALTLMLAIGAAVFVGSVRKLDSLDLGFDARHLLRARLTLHTSSAPHADRYFHDVAQRVRTLPGVAGAAISSGGPFGSFNIGSLAIPGRGPVTPGSSPSAGVEVSPEFFWTLGAPIVSGRNFDASERVGDNGVAVVNDIMAKHYWPGGDALGKCIRVGGETKPCATIIGIVRANEEWTVPYQLAGLTLPAEVYYLPFQTRVGRGSNEAAAFLYVRAAGDARTVVPAVRRVIETLAPDAPYPDVIAISDRLAERYRPWALGATMFTIFGGAALALAIVGLYGVLAFRVTERTHEIGVRMALGAGSSDVQRWVVGHGLRLAGAGVGIGIGAALVLARFLDPLLYQTSARDPLVLAIAGAAFLIVAVAASFVPAVRAVRIDPMEALREL